MTLWWVASTTARKPAVARALFIDWDFILHGIKKLQNKRLLCSFKHNHHLECLKQEGCIFSNLFLFFSPAPFQIKSHFSQALWRRCLKMNPPWRRQQGSNDFSCGWILVHYYTLHFKKKKNLFITLFTVSFCEDSRASAALRGQRSLNFEVTHLKIQEVYWSLRNARLCNKTCSAAP